MIAGAAIERKAAAPSQNSEAPLTTRLEFCLPSLNRMSLSVTRGFATILDRPSSKERVDSKRSGGGPQL
jgi:hypothetical protein